MAAIVLLFYAINYYKQFTVTGIGQRAYIYGYPLVLMNETKKVMTDGSGIMSHAPLNHFGHVTTTPTYQYTDIVRANVDTLYSNAWLDLSREPIILHVPDTHDRFYVMPLYDMYTNVFAVIGKPTTGTKEGDFAITGPQWSGTLPEHVKEVKAPGNYVWILGRTQINGAADLDNVRTIQQQYHLTPLSTFNGDTQETTSLAESVPPSTPTKKPMDLVADMNAEQFFTNLMQLMAQNPPPAQDNNILEQMATIGLIPSTTFNVKNLDKKIQKELVCVPAATLTSMAQQLNTVLSREDGWLVIKDVEDSYGTNYAQRAVVALQGIGMLPSHIAVYPTTFLDSAGNQLSGSHTYRIHFPAGQTPPVDAFWSLTMYGMDGFLIKNPINRYALGDRDNLIYNPDGSLDMYVQHNSPGKDKENNWLPAPDGNFNVTLRLYMPKQLVFNGQWQLPNIEKQ